MNGAASFGIRQSPWLLVWLALLFPLALAPSSCWGMYALPSSRSVTWQGNVGVLHDIPDRRSVCAALAPSGGDDSAGIQRAINLCRSGEVVLLKPGTFSVSTPISVKSGITLRGAGMGATVIKGMAGMGGNWVLALASSAFSEGTSFGITAGLSKGSTSITTSAPHGWSVGDIIVIDQVNNPSGDPPVVNSGVDGTARWDGRTPNRALGQVNRVSAVTKYSATLEIPLYWNFDGALSPQATKLHNVTSEAGLEDLTVDNTASGNSKQMSNGGTIVLRGTSDCWLLHVEVIGSWQSGVRVNGAFRNTFRSCKLHEGVPHLPANGPQYGPSRAYGFFINPYASANLFENNQIYHMVTPFMIHGAVSGNVIAYNYLPDPYYKDTNWIQVTMEFHGAHPVMNLLEGNYSVGRIAPDNFWGSSSHNTFFRNRNRLPAGKSGGPWNFDLQYNARYYNLIGNVLGTRGVETSYQLHDVNLHGTKSIYRFGYTCDGDGNAEGNDRQVLATVLRHGNWDSVNNKTVWNGKDDRVLPASLYLTGKPKWWGDHRWPAIGPDVTPMFPEDPGIGNGTPWERKPADRPTRHRSQSRKK